MPKYTIGKTSIIHGGSVLHEGDIIEMSEAMAESHGLEPAGKKAAAQQTGTGSEADKVPPKEPGADKVPMDPDKDKKPEKILAADAIAQIGACTTIDQLKEFFKDEKRQTVIDAARAKIKAIKDAEKSATEKK